MNSTGFAMIVRVAKSSRLRLNISISANQIREEHYYSSERNLKDEDKIKNFNDFKWPNQVGTFEHYRLPQVLLDEEYNYPVCQDTMGIRWPGYWFKRKFVYVEEMEPELVVPDLTDFKLKPYVSYQSPDVDVPKLTAKDLFDAVYAPRITKDFKNGNIQNELELKQEDIDNARLKAMQTGSDLFEDQTTDGVRGPLEFTDYCYNIKG